MPDDDSPPHERADELLEALEGDSPATIVELAIALDAHPVTIERRCRALQRDGDIRQCTGGVYTLVDSDGDRDAATGPATATDGPTQPNPAD